MKAKYADAHKGRSSSIGKTSKKNERMLASLLVDFERKIYPW